MLERASVVGLEFERERSTSSLPTGTGPSGALLSALVRKELIRPHEAIEDGFRFRHMLIRDAAYERDSEGAPRGAARAFRGLARRRGASEFEEIIGYHLEQAYRYLAELGPVDDAHGRSGSGEQSGWWQPGGARGRGAMHTPASNLLERACELVAVGDALRQDASPGSRGLAKGCGGARAGRGSPRGRARAGGRHERSEARGAPPRGAGAVPAARRSLRLKMADAFEQIEHAIAVLEEVEDDRALARAWHVHGMLTFWLAAGRRLRSWTPSSGRATLRRGRSATARAEAATRSTMWETATRCGRGLRPSTQGTRALRGAARLECRIEPPDSCMGYLTGARTSGWRCAAVSRRPGRCSASSRGDRRLSSASRMETALRPGTGRRGPRSSCSPASRLAAETPPSRVACEVSGADRRDSGSSSSVTAAMLAEALVLGQGRVGEALDAGRDDGARSAARRARTSSPRRGGDACVREVLARDRGRPSAAEELGAGGGRDRVEATDFLEASARTTAARPRRGPATGRPGGGSGRGDTGALELYERKGDVVSAARAEAFLMDSGVRVSTTN